MVDLGKRIRMGGWPDIVVEPTPKRIRAVVAGETVADSRRALLIIETEKSYTYYFPPDDVRRDLLAQGLERSGTFLGSATHWTMVVGDRRIADSAWSVDQAAGEFAGLEGYIAFRHDAVEHWFEEDEEVFGHPRDPYHRVDVRPSRRSVTVVAAGETVAETAQALFVFETGLPVRYYVPAADVRRELLIGSSTTTICPYKGTASHWSLRAGGRTITDAAWAYLEPLLECPRIRGHFAFYPERVDRIAVEGNPD